MDFLGEGKRWRWLGDHALVLDEGRRPAVLTTLRQRDSTVAVLASCGDDGRLEPITARSQIGVALAAVPQLIEAIETMLASAYPNPDEHPSMTKAWAIGKAALEAAGVKRDAGGGGREP